MKHLATTHYRRIEGARRLSRDVTTTVGLSTPSPYCLATASRVQRELIDRSDLLTFIGHHRHTRSGQVAGSELCSESVTVRHDERIEQLYFFCNDL